MKNIRMIFTITVIALISTVNTIAETIVTDDLVGYWSFDRVTIKGRTVKDVWGENDATLVGNPQRVEGYVKSGIKLNGNGDYVSLPNVGNFGSRIGEYTFEAWIKTTQNKKWSAIYRVLEGSCVEGNNGTGILINATSGDPPNNGIQTAQDWIMIERSRIRDNGCDSSVSERTFPISDGEWHQIVFTTRPANEAELEERRQKFIQAGLAQRPIGDCYKNTGYVDGTVIMDLLSCSNEEDLIAYVEPIFLGAVNNKGNAFGFFEGVFDEVRIYDRALTEKEVIRNYESNISLGVEAVEKLTTVWGTLKERP